MLITRKTIWYFLFFILVALLLTLNLSYFSQSTQDTSIQPVNNMQEETLPLSKIEHHETNIKEKHLNLNQTSTNPLPERENSNDMALLLKLQQQRTKDPRILLKMSSIPEKEQLQLKEWLTKYKEQGYVNTNETAFDYIEQQETQASFINLNDPNINFNLQNIENTSLSEYKYLGGILDGAGTSSAENASITGLQRLYIDDNGTAISLRESSLNNSNQGAIIIEDFVSNEIHGYPVTIMKSCTPSNRCSTKLTLMTSNKMYEISIKGDKLKKFDEHLLEMASSLDLPKLAEQSM